MATIQQSNVSNKTVDGTNQGDDITLTGSGNNDIVNGMDGSDTIQASTDGGIYTDVTVNGGGGNDQIGGFSSGSVLSGEDGNDTLVFNSSTADAKAFGGEGRDALSIMATNSSGNVLSGGDGTDQLIDYFSNSSNRMLGGNGSDVLESAGTSDRLYGQNGSDGLATAGMDGHANGGSGGDLLFAAKAFMMGGDLGPAPSGNVLNGNSGNDQLYDYNVLPNAAETNAYATTLIGGQGNDQITARNNRSIMTGGQGSDLFVAEGDSLQGGAVGVTDFVHGEDHVVLSAEGASSSNYSEVKVSGGRAAAIAAAEGSGTAYTFVAGDDDGFLVYNDGSGNLTGVKIDGANQIADFDRSEIKTDAAVKPAHIPGAFF